MSKRSAKRARETLKSRREQFDKLSARARQGRKRPGSRSGKKQR